MPNYVFLQPLGSYKPAEFIRIFILVNVMRITILRKSTNSFRDPSNYCPVHAKAKYPPTTFLVSKCLPSWLRLKLRNQLKMTAHYNHLAVFSPAMEASGMGLTSLSRAPESPQARTFLPTLFSRFMFWTFPFFLHFSSSCWDLKLCPAPQTMWPWSRHPAQVVSPCSSSWMLSP